MRLHLIKLYFFPLADLRCGYGVQQGNISPSLHYIPGRVVRGGLAGWAIRTRKVMGPDDDLFQKLFLHQPSAASPLISFPWCNYKGCRPAPCSLFGTKGLPRDPVEALLSNSWLNIYVTQYGYVDFLRRKDWPSDVDLTLKPVLGKQIDDNHLLGPRPPLKLDLRNRHDEATGRVGENGLYAEEALPASDPLRPDSYYYTGNLVFEESNQIADIFLPLIDKEFIQGGMFKGGLLDNPEFGRVVFMGRRKVPVAAWAKDEGILDTEQASLPKTLQTIPKEGCFTWTALSDFIPSEGSSFPLSAEMLERELELSSLAKLRVFCRPALAHGFDVMSGRAQPTIPGLTAGSCGLFSGALREEDIRRLWGQSLAGAGRMTRDGFGRFELNWPVHKP